MKQTTLLSLRGTKRGSNYFEIATLAFGGLASMGIGFLIRDWFPPLLWNHSHSSKL